MSTRSSLLLIGAGGHAMACIDVVEQEARYAISGLIGVAAQKGSRLLGYPIQGTDDDLERLLASGSNALITVGQIKSPDVRIRLYEHVRRCGGHLATVISPHAYVSRHAEVGVGTIIMHGAVVNAGARVGDNCIVNSMALIEHGVRVGVHCHVATNAALNSDVRVGDGTFIGSGCSVRQGTTIGERCVIGMGQRVLTDCADGARLPGRRP